MAKNYPLTKKSGFNKKDKRSERILLAALIAVGIIGLSITYGGKVSVSKNLTAQKADSTIYEGKIQADKMILNLNETGVKEEPTSNTSNF